MTIFDLIKKATGGHVDLETLMRHLASQYPDIAPQINDALFKLQQNLTDANLLAVAMALPAELLNIAHGKIQPRRHPSDAV
jgi:hypothetical protein